MSISNVKMPTIITQKRAKLMSYSCLFCLTNTPQTKENNDDS